jgi:hypothetical protein
MSELEYYKKFIDWLNDTNRVNVSDIEKFHEYLQDIKRRDKAKRFVAENFEGMF